jgi:hypothetical protein
MYDPTIGRFIQRDPVWPPVSGDNLYAYVGDRPANAVDPSGLDKRERFKSFLVECAKKLFEGGFQFQTEAPKLPKGVVETEPGSLIYKLGPDATLKGVLAEYYKDPSKCSFSCGRTMSLVFLCAIDKFYGGCCPEEKWKEYEKQIRFTPSAWIAGGLNAGIKVKEVKEPSPGTFGWWENPTKEDPWWRDEGAMMVGKDEWYAPGISKEGKYSSKERIDAVMKTQQQNATVKYYELDFEKMDKLIGCDSDAQEKQLQQREKK